ncbi:MAG: hypothetical protein KJZ75_15130 [Hyphomonadaceae bacterium]|nr:hypothetical protein [Hyphomonadaceae bacterium]GIK50748.1 MAG: hypothetical protein BroJett013_34450 [Alphaproteobacteria bacterium]
MKPSDRPNPEQRSNNAMLVFCAGAGLCILAYVLGVGAVIGAAFSGGDPAVVVGSVFGAVGVALMGVVGVLMLIVGGVWMIVRVIADQSGGAEEKRYRDIQR